jgi:AcrR family transcriptional regulator
MPRKPATIPRKSPTQERSRATVDAILAATARVLVRHGFEHTTTNRVAEAAGVSIGSLYQYFPSKEALVAALIDRHVAEMTGEFLAAMERVRTLPLAAAARAIIEMEIRAHAIDPALHRVLVEQVPRVGRLARLSTVERQIQTVVMGYLAAHRDELRVENLELAAFVAVTTVEAITHAAVVYQPERLADPALVDEATEMVVRYLAADPDRAMAAVRSLAPRGAAPRGAAVRSLAPRGGAPRGGRPGVRHRRTEGA